MKKNNIIEEFFIDILISDVKFSELSELDDTLLVMLMTEIGISESDLAYLNFTIKENDDGNDVKVFANNIVTALWLSGIYPKNNLEELNKRKHYESGNTIYYYNKSTGMLTTKKST